MTLDQAFPRRYPRSSYSHREGFKMRHGFRMFAACIGLAGCSAGNDVPIAQKAIDGFHRSLNAEQFAQIYQASGPEMKSATTQDALGKLLSAVHRKLGAFKSGSSVGWNDNVTTNGHFVTLNYKAQYERGEAQENFVYRLADDRAALVGYHINSDALILN